MEFTPPREYKRIEVKASVYLKGVGEPLYLEEDIYKVKDPFTRIFRKICVINSITYPYFVQRFNEYSIDTLDLPPVVVYNGLNNLKKPLYGKDGEKTHPLTNKTFLKFMAVLGFSINNICISVTDDDDRACNYYLYEP